MKDGSKASLEIKVSFPYMSIGYKYSRIKDTHQYGAASQIDGIWRDESGKELEGAIGKDPGRFSWAKGIVGAIQRVRGVGA